MAAAARDEVDDKYIIRRIQNHVDHGIGGEDGDVTTVRQNMFSRYMGDLYGNERDGKSKYVSREVLQAIEWALPALLRVFMGGIKAVEFKASGPQDVEQAKQETDAVNYWFFDGNDEDSGFMILYSWIKDILMYPNGYVTARVVEKEDKDERELTGLLPEQLAELEADEANEISVTRKYDGEVPDPLTQMPTTVKLVDAHVITTKWRKAIVVEPVAPDQVIIDHSHKKLDVDGARFVCLRTEMSRSDLREEGYDEDDLVDLGPDEKELWESEAITRHFYSDETPDNDDDSFDLEADETFWVHECYMRIDVDGDGINELRKIVMVGCKILDNEETDYQPVVAATAIPMPHKHIGMGYAEIVSDLQELMTTLTRQLLDNIYGLNASRKFIAEGALLSDNSTMDQLLDATSDVVVVRGSPAEGVMPEVITPIVDQIANVLETMRNSTQERTGVAPNLTLDPEVLAKSTMGAFVGALEAASQRLELLARLFAEGPLKKSFQKIHYLARTHFDEAQEIQINNKWVKVDPSKWRKRSNMTVNVGLGFNNKQVMLGLLGQLLQIQKEAMAIGVADAAKIYATLEKFIEQGNLGHAATYFNDPKDPNFKPPEPKEDPAMILAKAQAQSLAAEAKRKDAETQAKIELEKQKAIDEAEFKSMELDIKLKELEQKDRELDLKKAETDAQITALNRDKNKQAGPAESSADDEFARAAGLEPTKPNGQAGAKPKTSVKAA
jgi:hypothetical protein